MLGTSEKPGLLVFTHCLENTGAPIGMYRLLRHLKEWFTPIVASPIQGPVGKLLEAEQIPVACNPRLLEDTRIAKSLAEQLQTKYVWCNTLLTGNCAFACNYMANRPRIFWYIHETSAYTDMIRSAAATNTSADETLWHIRFMLDGQVDRLAVVAPQLVSRLPLDSHSRGGPLVLSVDDVIPAGIDIPPVRPQFRPPDGHGLTCLVLGTVSPAKGQDVAIDAFKTLNPKHYRLFIAGAEPIPDYAAACKREAAGLESVSWCGAVTDSQKSALLEAADIVIVPSREDNCPQVPLEAAAAGKLVLASNIVGMPPFCRTANFQSGNAGDLAERLKAIYCDRDTLHQVAEWQYDEVCRHHSAKEWAEQVKEAILGA